MYKGQLKNWKMDKGFGFIQSDELTQDTFVHISSLKAMIRKPKVGDFIFFEVEHQANGKTKAINCSIEGVATKEIATNTANNSTPLAIFKHKILFTLIIISVGVLALQQLT